MGTRFNPDGQGILTDQIRITIDLKREFVRACCDLIYPFLCVQFGVEHITAGIGSKYASIDRLQALTA